MGSMIKKGGAMGAFKYKKVGEILVRHRKISSQRLNNAIVEGQRTNSPVLSVLRKKGSINVFDAAFALLEQACSKLDEDCTIAQTFAERPSYA